LDAKPAFPCNLSLNNVAAHYTPDKVSSLIFNEDDLLKVDFGVHVNGYISDLAFSLNPSGKHKELIKASESALAEAVKLSTPGRDVSEIGAVIEDTIQSFGFKPIGNLSGHLLEQFNLHAGLTIPNIPAKEGVLKEGMVIAIEPFATDGAGWVVDSPEAFIFRFYKDKPVRSPDARKMLEQVKKEFSSLPFATRWIDLPQSRLNLALSQLLRVNALYRYPVLKEKSGGIISQAECTVIVGDKPEVIN
jgi:methionyl aminopeptidase